MEQTWNKLVPADIEHESGKQALEVLQGSVLQSGRRLSDYKAMKAMGDHVALLNMKEPVGTTTARSKKPKIYTQGHHRLKSIESNTRHSSQSPSLSTGAPTRGAEDSVCAILDQQLMNSPYSEFMRLIDVTLPGKLADICDNQVPNLPREPGYVGRFTAFSPLPLLPDSHHRELTGHQLSVSILDEPSDELSSFTDAANMRNGVLNHHHQLSSNGQEPESMKSSSNTDAALRRIPNATPAEGRTNANAAHSMVTIEQVADDPVIEADRRAQERLGLKASVEKGGEKSRTGVRKEFSEGPPAAQNGKQHNKRQAGAQVKKGRLLTGRKGRTAHQFDIRTDLQQFRKTEEFMVSQYHPRQSIG